jgi:pimeloyl-ACP methyl ester carboxylesterase
MIHSLHHPAPSGAPDRTLLVMLPGIGMQADEFTAHGFVSAVHEGQLPIDIIAAQPELDLYLEGQIAGALHDSVIAPAMARGYRRLWLLGISVGGMGALLYAAAQFASVDGLVLLAPFLGTPGTIAEVSAAGGIAAWSPQNSRATAVERKMLLWLQDFPTRPPGQPTLYLGYGRHDRFALGYGLLAQHLRQQQVVVGEGDHDWPTWTSLWRRILGRHPFPVIGGER